MNIEPKDWIGLATALGLGAVLREKFQYFFSRGDSLLDRYIAEVERLDGKIQHLEQWCVLLENKLISEGVELPMRLNGHDH